MNEPTSGRPPTGSSLGTGPSTSPAARPLARPALRRRASGLGWGRLAIGAAILVVAGFGGYQAYARTRPAART